MTVSVADLLAYAEQQLGKPYQWGSAGPNSFDCSGLVYSTLGHFGIHVPRTSEDQARIGTGVSVGSIQAGDLVFSDWGDGPNSHVGIATRPDQIIDAPTSGEVVRYDTLNTTYRQHITAVRRLPQVSGSSGTASFTNAVTGTLSPLEQLLGLSSARQVYQDAATMAHSALWLFNPSNWVRLLAFGTGSALLVLGVVFLAREVRG